MKILKSAIIFVGIILFVLFIVPFGVAGILNAGNIIGLVFSAVLIIYGLYFEKGNDFILKLWKKKSGKIFLGIVTLFLLSVMIFVIVISTKMYFAANNKPDKETTVVVLGCQVYPDGPSLMLEERLIAALDYLSENEELNCILSGGQGTNEVMSEAECMYNWLVERGIDSERLFIEDESTSTRENLLFSKRIIEENNLNPVITIITNDFHQYRAFLISNSLGIDSYSVSGKTVFYLFPTYYVRELGGILFEMVNNVK